MKSYAALFAWCVCVIAFLCLDWSSQSPMALAVASLHSKIFSQPLTRQARIGQKNAALRRIKGESGPNLSTRAPSDLNVAHEGSSMRRAGPLSNRRRQSLHAYEDEEEEEDAATTATRDRDDVGEEENEVKYRGHSSRRRSPSSYESDSEGEEGGIDPSHSSSSSSSGRSDRSNSRSSDTKKGILSPRDLHPAIRGTLAALRVASDASLALVKGTIKASVDALSVKYVDRSDIVGTWRFEQTITEEDGSEVVEAASIEVLRNNTARSRCRGVTALRPYSFTQRPWPRRCSISLEAPTHIYPGASEPSNVMYKGYFKRSLMNRDVVFIRGSVYQTRGRLL